MQALTNTEVLARFKAIFDDNKAPIYNTISNEMFTIPTFMDDPQTPLQHMKHYTYHMRCIPIAFGLEYGYIPVNKWNESPSNRSHGVLDPLVFHLKASTWEKQIPNTLPNRRADEIKKYANTSHLEEGQDVPATINYRWVDGLRVREGDIPFCQNESSGGCTVKSLYRSYMKQNIVPLYECPSKPCPRMQAASTDLAGAGTNRPCR